MPKIGAKLLEEAKETIEAAGEAGPEGRRKHLVYEAGDLIYHLFVLLSLHRVTLSELETELASRFGVSGIDEKNARTRKGDATWESLRNAPTPQASLPTPMIPSQQTVIPTSRTTWRPQTA